MEPQKKSILTFLTATVYFYFLLFTLLPFLKSTFTLNPALYWFITGYFLFVPLFITAILLTRSESTDIFTRLYLKRFSKKDWQYAISGLLIVFILSGAIFGCSMLLHKYCDFRLLKAVPWFMEMKPFIGTDKLLLFVWLPMFFFNIVGEEILWRGYIQARLPGKYSWVLCSTLWMIFHLPFGFDLMIVLIPIVIVIPYIFSKTQNSLIGIFIHGIFNGPIFVAVALGLIK